MADMKQIYKFAVKWYDKFQDKKISYIEFVDHYMADDCETLGFVMDCGHAFSEKYGNAASDFKELKRIIGQITDIPLLGSAIYSQWRYFNHWAYSGEEILEPKNRAWFTVALNRLAQLAKQREIRADLLVRHKCPVCDEFEFDNYGSDDICEVCGWQDDIVQELNPDEECCENQMSLNQARLAWKEKIAVMSESEGKRIRYLEADGSVWTGTVDVYETAYDNSDDDKKGYSICVMRDNGSNVIVYADEIEEISIIGETTEE